MKDDLLQQVRSDMDSLQRQQKESLNKIATRDEVLQKLNSELGKLRSIKQEKQLEARISNYVCLTSVTHAKPKEKNEICRSVSTRAVKCDGLFFVLQHGFQYGFQHA